MAELPLSVSISHLKVEIANKTHSIARLYNRGDCCALSAAKAPFITFRDMANEKSLYRLRIASLTTSSSTKTLDTSKRLTGFCDQTGLRCL